MRHLDENRKSLTSVLLDHNRSNEGFLPYFRSHRFILPFPESHLNDTVCAPLHLPYFT